ncbi:MAG: DUF1800 family protein [Candidatus Solibacter sp.]|nr:DUF1800 family protein [Candidatus Solibacter sp.]
MKSHTNHEHRGSPCFTVAALATLLLGAALPAFSQPAGIGLRGEYFNTSDLTGPVEVSRTDATVNFEWNGVPAFGVDEDEFSARWTGQVLAPATAAYTFTTVSNNGVRVWVNGVKVIDNWVAHSTATNHSAAIPLVAGQKYDIRMEFFEQFGGAVAKLLWNAPGQTAAVIPQSQLFPPAATFLSDLSWISAVNGDGQVIRDKSHGGSTLTVNGTKFAKGLGVRAASDIHYNLARQYDVFTASIGIDDEVTEKQGSAVFQVWIDGVKTYQSETLHGYNSARFVRVIVTGKNDLRLVVTTGGDSGTSDDGDWADAQLTKGGVTLDPFLSDLDWTHASNGWGPVERDKSNGEAHSGDGVPISINGMKFAKGLGVHAPSDVRFQLNGQFASFVAWIGIDDEVGNNRGSGIFQVWLDGVKAFESPELFGKSDAQKVTLNVAGKNELRLVVNNGGDGNSYDHADWAGAQLFHAAVPPPVITPPAAPSNLKALAGNTQIVLSWNAVAGASTYSVYRGTAAGAESAAPVATGLTGSTYTHTGLVNGTTYFYKVTAVNTGGASPPSSEVSAMPVPGAPPAPTNLKATPGNSQIVLTWTASAGAVSYKVFRGTTAGGESSTPIATGVTTTTFTNTGLTNGAKYFYKVAAVNLGGTGALSNEASSVPIPPAPASPANLTAVGGDGRVTLSWTAVAGAASYNIFRGTAAGAESTTAIATGVTGATYTNTGLTNGTAYFFKVAAVNAGGVSPLSNEATATPAPPAPAAPTNVKAKAGDGLVTLTWNAVSGAATYSIFRGTAAGAESPTPIASGIATATFTDTGRTNGVALFYKVAGVNLGGTGTQSAEVTATPVPPIPAAPTGLTASAGNARVVLTWAATPGAATYNVYRGATPGGELATPVATGVAATTYTDSGLPNGPTLYYKIAAVNLGGISPRSAEASAAPVAPPVPPPAGFVSASRLLRQSTWGPTPALVDHVIQVGPSAFLDEQFAAIVSDYPDTLKTGGSLEPLQERFFQNALTGQDQLRQRVAFALSQIFVVSGVKVTDPRAMVAYQKMLLTKAFDNYYDVLRAVTLDPAMGEFLDMVNNRKQDFVRGLSPNENYAREVLQLFTIGLNTLAADGTPVLNGGATVPSYDQTTVAELSRAFTGWTYGDNRAGQPTSQNPRFYGGPMEAVESYHDTGSKTLLGTFIPANQTATLDLDTALGIIFRHQNVGPFICKQLIQHLVTSNPSSGYVQRASAVFANNGAGVRGDLTAVVTAILLDPEAALGQPATGHLREPALFLASLLRALNAGVVDHPFVSDKSEEMGQRIFYAPSVFNYFSPGFRTAAGVPGPEFQIFTTATSLVRINFVSTLLRGGFGTDVTLDFAPYLADLPNTSAMLDRVNLNFMGGLMSQQMRDSILAAVSVVSNNREKVQTAIYLAVTSSQYQVEN